MPASNSVQTIFESFNWLIRLPTRTASISIGALILLCLLGAVTKFDGDVFVKGKVTCTELETSGGVINKIDLLALQKLVEQHSKLLENLETQPRSWSMETTTQRNSTEAGKAFPIFPTPLEIRTQSGKHLVLVTCRLGGIAFEGDRTQNCVGRYSLRINGEEVDRGLLRRFFPGVDARYYFASEVVLMWEGIPPKGTKVGDDGQLLHHIQVFASTDSGPELHVSGGNYPSRVIAVELGPK
jgi:hypothetical protein